MRNIAELKRRVRRRQRLQGIALGFVVVAYYCGPLLAGCAASCFVEGPFAWILVGAGIAWIIGNIVVGILAGCD